MRRPAARRLALALTALVLAPVFPGAPTASGVLDPMHADAHPVIVGDEGPAGLILARDPLTARPVYRPGSPVSAGNGTADDPFVIENFAWSGFTMRGTRAHVVIRNVTVDDVFTWIVKLPFELTDSGAAGLSSQGLSRHCVVLFDVRHVTLRDSHACSARGVFVEAVRDVVISNVVAGDWMSVPALTVRDAKRLDVTDSTFQGSVSVTNAPDARFTGNVVKGSLALDRGGGSTLTGNVAHGLLSLTESPGVELARNEAWSGYRIRGSTLPAWVHSFEANTVKGLPVVYAAFERPATLPAHAGQVILVGLRDAAVGPMGVANVTDAVALAFAQNVTLHGFHVGHSSYGIRVHASTNVTLRGNTLTGDGSGLTTQTGIHATDSRDVVIADSRLTALNPGVLVEDGDRITVRNVTAVGSPLEVRDSWDVRVEHNALEGGYPLVVRRSSAITVLGNSMSCTGGCLTFTQVDGSSVTQNRLTGTDEFVNDGILLNGSHNFVARNTITGMYRGVTIGSGSENVLTLNEITGNIYGVFADHEVDWAFTRNNVHANVENGFYRWMAAGEETAVEHNWWGCATGPGTPGCDTVDGGDYDPWLTSPVPDAGAP